jgi:hypothetical protein
MRKRVKCLFNRLSHSPVKDPDLRPGAFYDVINYPVLSSVSPDPWISIRLPDGREIERPKAMFGPVFIDE